MAIAVAENCKRLSISSKRQITIPQAFFNALGFGTEAECIVKDNELIIRPAKSESSGEFAEQILAELIQEGYSGEKMLAEFKARQAKIRPAVNRMVEQALAVAEGKVEYESMSDVFGEK